MQTNLAPQFKGTPEGIEAEAPAESPAWGIYHFFARDPNGYVIEFQHFLNPGWSSTPSVPR